MGMGGRPMSPQQQAMMMRFRMQQQQNAMMRNMSPEMAAMQQGQYPPGAGPNMDMMGNPNGMMYQHPGIFYKDKWDMADLPLIPSH